MIKCTDVQQVLRALGIPFQGGKMRSGVRVSYIACYRDQMTVMMICISM